MARQLYLHIYPASQDEEGTSFDAGIAFLGEFEESNDFTAYMIREENEHIDPQTCRALPLYGIPTDLRKRIELLRDNQAAKGSFLDSYDSRIKDDGTLKHAEEMQSRAKIWKNARAAKAAQQKIDEADQEEIHAKKKLAKENADKRNGQIVPTPSAIPIIPPVGSGLGVSLDPVDKTELMANSQETPATNQEFINRVFAEFTGDKTTAQVLKKYEKPDLHKNLTDAQQKEFPYADISKKEILKLLADTHGYTIPSE